MGFDPDAFCGARIYSLSLQDAKAIASRASFPSLVVSAQMDEA